MYSNKKSQEIKTNTIRFSQRYDKAENYDEVLAIMKEYEEKYNTYMAVVEYKPGFSIAINIEVSGEKGLREGS